MLIGGYFGLEESIGGGSLPWLDGAVPVQSGRMALLYELQNRNVRTIWLPYYYCDSVSFLLKRLGYDTKFYCLNNDYRVVLPNNIATDDVIILVDYFGMTSKSVQLDLDRFIGLNVIVDACMSFWTSLNTSAPIFFSPRKFL